MARNIAYIAQTRSSPTLEVQADAFRDADQIVKAGRLSAIELLKRLRENDMGLVAGDTIHFYDPTCIQLETRTLISLLADYVRQGISVKFVDPPLTIAAADTSSNLHSLLFLFDRHWRFRHGTQTHGGVRGKLGRRPRLQPSDVPDILKALAEPGATVTSVARQRGIARSTLYGFLQSQNVQSADFPRG